MVFGRRAYKRGIEDGSQPFEEKFEQLSADRNLLEDEINENVNRIQENVEIVFDDLSKRDKKELYDLAESFDIKELDEESRQLVIAFLHTLANTFFDEPNQLQKNYLRHITKYLEVINPQIELNLDSLSNHEDLTINKAFYQLGNEFVYLYDSNFHFDTLNKNIYDLLNLNMKIKEDITNDILKVIKNVGKEGLIEKYGFDYEEEKELEEHNESHEEYNTLKEDLEELDKTIQQTEINNAFMGISTSIILNNLYGSDSLDILFTDEMLEQIEAGNIDNNFVKDRILESYNEDDLSFIYGLKFGDQLYCTNIFVTDGFYTQIKGEFIYIDYDSIESVIEDGTGLMISLTSDYLICTEGSNLSRKNKILLPRTERRDASLRTIRKAFESILEAYGKSTSSKNIEVIEIIEKYICEISKTSPSYTKEEFYDDKVEKRLNNALNKYAVKVRRDDVIAFIDTSLFNNGKDGLLFAKDGIAFDYAFAPIFIKYEEIRTIMFDKKEKNLIFYGNFKELKDRDTKPELSNIHFHLHPIKKCIEEIRYII